MKQFDVIIKKLVVKADIVIKAIPLRAHAYIGNKLVLVNNRLNFAYKKSARPERNSFVLIQSAADGLRTILDRVHARLTLTSNKMGTSVAKVLRELENKTELVCKRIDTGAQSFTAAGAKMLIAAKHGTESVRTVFERPVTKMIMRQEPVIGIAAKKTLSLRDQRILTVSSHFVAEKPVGNANNHLELLSAIQNIYCTRLRRLGEMDTDETLSAFDAMKLEDIDYITIG